MFCFMRGVAPIGARVRSSTGECVEGGEMKIGYLECFSGISGDMFLGALVEAGVSPELLTRTVEALNVGARLEVARVMRSGISATKVDVWIGVEKDQPRDEYWQSHTYVEDGSEHKHEHGH